MKRPAPIRSTPIPPPARVRAVLLILALAIVGAPENAPAAWSTNPAVNNPICTDWYHQGSPSMVSDGAGGTIIAWVDSRTPPPTYRLFAQRFDANGDARWLVDGIQVSTSGIDNTGRPAIVGDGNGGAILVWALLGSVYAQRVDANGNLMWPGGVLVCDQTSIFEPLQACTDGSGGAFIVWTDQRNGSSIQSAIYAQRLNSAGQAQWIANGMLVCDQPDYQGSSRMVSDGSGGAILAWDDHRNGNTDIYAQRLSSAGALLWSSNGVVVNAVPGGSLYHDIIESGHGAILCWSDRRNGTGAWDIYAQKLSAGGTPLWTANGVPMSLLGGNQSDSHLVSDGAGGAIVTWDTPATASVPTPDIHAQRVDASGAIQWSANGALVCGAANGQFLPHIASDGSGGAILAWQDSRTNNIHDIYAQRIDAAGASLWTASGVAISTATFVQMYPIVLNVPGGAIVSWIDYRNDLGANRSDIFAQRVKLDGTLGGGGATGVIDGGAGAASEIALHQNFPNPCASSTTIGYSLPSEGYVRLALYDVAGRSVATLVDGVQAAGSKTIRLDASHLTAGVYFYRLETPGAAATKELIILR